MLVRIDELVFDSNVYPRMKVSWLTAYQYAQAMRTGAEFPPVVVGVLEGRKYLVDGWHRVEAKRLLGEEYVTAKVKEYGSMGEMYADAVRLNSRHGKPLTVQEKVRAVDQLGKLGFEREEISRIIGVPVDKITLLEARVIRLHDGTPVYAKGVTFRSAARSGGSVVSVDQSKFMGRDVSLILEQLVEMIEGGIYPFEDPRVAELTVRLFNLLRERLRLA
jgi:hypothetical protein